MSDHSTRQALKSVRDHWEVENRLHWCLDVTFAQDGNRTRSRNAAENLSVVRHFALNMLMQRTADRLQVVRKPGYGYLVTTVAFVAMSPSMVTSTLRGRAMRLRWAEGACAARAIPPAAAS